MAPAAGAAAVVAKHLKHQSSVLGLHLGLAGAFTPFSEKKSSFQPLARGDSDSLGLNVVVRPGGLAKPAVPPKRDPASLMELCEVVWKVAEFFRLPGW
jgi:hypothetical protein